MKQTRLWLLADKRDALVGNDIVVLPTHKGAVDALHCHHRHRVDER